MALTDHVAILLGHSLAVARLNKKKTRADFYAQIALPPAAAPEVGALVADAYPGVPLASIEVNFKTNAEQPKPFAGVPADWFIVRMSSQFAPELYAADGVTPIENAAARSKFFAGMRVRIASSAWAWKNEFGKSGASFNLHGVMDAGQGGERLNIGGAGAGAAFKAHANPNAAVSASPFGAQAQERATPFGVPPAQGGQSASAGAATAASTTGSAAPAAQVAAPAGNPFGAQPAAGGNPFAQGQAVNNGNPFAA